MTELVVALLMIVQERLRKHVYKPSMSECFKGKRVS